MVTGAFACPHSGLPHWPKAEATGVADAWAERDAEVTLTTTNAPTRTTTAMATPIAHRVSTRRTLLRLLDILFFPSSSPYLTSFCALAR
jgi:hypothetical protein